MAIRYDKEFNKEINRVVANFNAKVKRLEQKEHELVPDKVKVSDIKLNYTSRDRLKSYLKRLESFSEIGAEDVVITKGGAKITNYELENLKKDKAIAKRLLTREINRAEERPSEYRVLRSSNINNLRAKRELVSRNIDLLNTSQLKSLLKNVNRVNTSKQTFYDNFFQMVNNEIGLAGESEDLAYIEKRLRDLTPNQLLEASRSEPHIKAILEYYNNEYATYEFLKDLRNNIDDIVASYKG